ncbi:hypothetical protein Kpol_1013p51 [Vanderwaltozyma polyspora DSM 70294]|uniref:RRM domain-containing protein n=1 Tax=Vanderwaltozyma polyspora (strain ATCC 22028 / DSM 70294 / BCRC 21397 / CBS 2163 / NBRC 10782 / NRRL Y-8283 / UCD 57-17) TaxID=436907 RepID=A7TH98_VANPO|nr:uncharacterized protein Kpol_1013p51 [Vanderwaltozyma polyspora DSM 70294]EDO18379.1 hypothetical protein Kpol_1013p51 [Vanderwaltozyma polyspora DSM 70294]
MAPPKKNVKMDLNSFLNDESFGSSWSEEDVDLNKINIPIESMQANTIPLEDLVAVNKKSSFGGSSSGNYGASRLDPALQGAKRDFQRTEYPVPDSPPYRAIINNIPWDITPEGVQAWIEDGLQKPGAVEELSLPRDMRDPSRLKGLAFVAFKEREDLVTALTFNATRLNDRTVYVSVAAPRKDFGYRNGGDEFDWGGARGSNFQRDESSAPDLDWGAARGSNFTERKPRREEPNLDWGVARGSNFSERKPRREEPDLDWGVARGSNFSERKPRREEPNLDWGVARGSNFAERKPRREEPDLDWGAARSASGRSFKERKPRKDEPDLDWGAARGSNFSERKPRTDRTDRAATEVVEEKPKMQKSSFSVLSNDDEEEEEEETTIQEATPVEEVTTLEKEAAQLSIDDKDDGEWEVTGKK